MISLQGMAEFLVNIWIFYGHFCLKYYLFCSAVEVAEQLCNNDKLRRITRPRLAIRRNLNNVEMNYWSLLLQQYNTTPLQRCGLFHSFIFKVKNE